jgi:N-acetylmuramoyl-L-alanine amidase
MQCHRFKIAITLLAVFVSVAVAQEPVPTRLSVLGESFSDLPILWEREEPFAPVDKWMSALQLQWVVRDNGVAIKAPGNLSFFWSKNATNVAVNGRTVEVTPLRQQGEDFWIPLISFAKTLGLMAIVNPEKRVIKLVSPLQSVEAIQTEIGWLVTLTFGYPLTSFPKMGTLRQPDRAYADFWGAVLMAVSLPVPIGATPVTGFRIGQFSDEPPIVRFVADANQPLSISVAGRELIGDGYERWHLVLQPATNCSQWVGQILLRENTSEKATFLLLGWFGSELGLMQEGKTLTVSLPAKPLFSLNPSDFGEGLVQSAFVEMEDGEAKLPIALRQPANAYFRAEGDLGLALVIEVASQVARQVRLIVVDAGHGGKDPGAISPLRLGKPQLVEKHLTLDIAFRLKRLLEDAGYEVAMTRTDDVYVSLPDRVAIANNLQADAFVSVHLNSFPQPGAQWGTEVYFWMPQSYPLAESIYRNLLAILGRKGNGIRQRQLYVVRHTVMPSVLVEPCYLNHPKEEELLRDENFREKIAIAICRGIMEFFGDLRTLERRGE